LNKYEVAILFHPDSETDLEKVSKKIDKIIKDNGGKVLKTDNWGKKKLAYQIQKHDYAVYVFYTAELPPEAVKKVETTLNITDEVIRYLVSRPDLKAIAKAEAIREEKAKKAAVRGEKSDEATEEE
jgi:small subunit ribosomal protein S6